MAAPRIHKILASSRGTRFIQKILNTDEREHPKIQWLIAGQRQIATGWEDMQSHVSISRPGAKEVKAEALQGDLSPPRTIEIAATFLAGRFAAKEAVIKAHPHRALTWHDITIQSQATAHPDRKGAPLAIIRGEKEDHEALVSISHDGEYATAVCIGAGVI